MNELRQALTLDGAKRFHPPGQHPAAKPYRDHLAALNEIREHTVDTPDLLAAIDYNEQMVAAVEVGEDRAKRQYLSRV